MSLAAWCSRDSGSAPRAMSLMASFIAVSYSSVPAVRGDGAPYLVTSSSIMEYGYVWNFGSCAMTDLRAGMAPKALSQVMRFWSFARKVRNATASAGCLDLEDTIGESPLTCVNWTLPLGFAAIPVVNCTLSWGMNVQA